VGCMIGVVVVFFCRRGFLGRLSSSSRAFRKAISSLPVSTRALESCFQSGRVVYSVTHFRATTSSVQPFGENEKR